MSQNQGRGNNKMVKMPNNGQNDLKSPNIDFFDYIMILPWFFQCFSSVNENLAGKKLNVQKKVALTQKFANFGHVFFL